MVSALGQADSFNSSGATIMPDRNDERNTRQQHKGQLRARQQTGEAANTLRGVPSLVTQARMLMPEDSFGRELDAMVTEGGDDGQAQAWSFIREGTAPAEQPSSSQPLQELSFSQLLNIPSSPPSAPTAETTEDVVDRLQAYLDFNNLNPANGTGQIPASDLDLFRPASAHSHSASEWGTEHSGYSSTDVDTDSVMSDANPGLQPANDRIADLGFGGMNLEVSHNNPETTSPHHFWLTGQESQTRRNNGNPLHSIKDEADWARSRTVAPDSVSPPGGASSTGARMYSQGPEDETSRQARLEHRRHINRKSAQKHRKRRKEELEVLSQRVAERDHKIAHLERELAVEKAKNVQMAAFLQANSTKLNGASGS